MSNSHQHHLVIKSLKDKVQQLGSRNDEAGKFARAQFEAWINQARARLAAHAEAEAAYNKVRGEISAAQSAFDQKRAELLAAVDAELAPLAKRLNDALARDTYPPHLDRFPWAPSGNSTDELVQKALHDPTGHHGTSLPEFIDNQRRRTPGEMALAILEEGPHMRGPSQAVLQEAFDARWQVWAAANREAIAAVSP
jgi:hypothetical protein